MKWITAQDEWIYNNYTKKGIIPWVCSCGENAFLHRTINGGHEFLCRRCYQKELLEIHGNIYC